MQPILLLKTYNQRTINIRPQTNQRQINLESIKNSSSTFSDLGNWSANISYPYGSKFSVPNFARLIERNFRTSNNETELFSTAYHCRWDRVYQLRDSRLRDTNSWRLHDTWCTCTVCEWLIRTWIGCLTLRDWTRRVDRSSNETTE